MSTAYTLENDACNLGNVDGGNVGPNSPHEGDTEAMSCENLATLEVMGLNSDQAKLPNQSMNDQP